MQTAANLAQKYMGTVPTDTDPSYKPRADGATMKALAWFGAGDVRIVEAPVPEITEADDVILKVTGSTICGSDLHLFHGEILALQKGDILGHEFMGIVDKVGPGVKHIKPGQRVVASFQIACGQCEYCKQKLSSFCDRTNNSSLMQTMYGHRDAGLFGYSHLAGGFPGGQAEYVRVPFGDQNLLHLPDHATLPAEKALYLSDVVPTAYHCVFDSGVREGDVVGVWGLGPIGLCVAKWAQLKGAKRVIGIDKVPSRLKFAQDKLGIEVIDINIYKDVTGRLAELVPGGLDKGLDASSFHEPKTLLHKAQKALMLETDTPDVLNEMILAVRKAGTIGLIAVYSGYVNGLNIGALMQKGIRLIGCGQAPVQKYWEEILNEYIIPGKFDPTFMVTHRVPLDDVPALYAAFDKREAGVEKVFVETKFTTEKPGPGCPSLSRVDDWVDK